MPECLLENQAYRQGGFDGQVRINGLSSAPAGLLCQPGALGLFGELDRQVAPPLQRSIVFRPIGDTVFGLGKLVTAGFIVLIRHEGFSV